MSKIVIKLDFIAYDNICKKLNKIKNISKSERFKKILENLAKIIRGIHDLQK